MEQLSNNSQDNKMIHVFEPLIKQKENFEDDIDIELKKIFSKARRSIRFSRKSEASFRKSLFNETILAGIKFNDDNFRYSLLDRDSLTYQLNTVQIEKK